MLIAPSEPPKLKAIGRSSSVPERMGVDVLFGAKGKLTGIQRKEYKDLLASLHDGRLQRELAQMKVLGRAILLVEGRPAWTLDGEYLGDNGYGWKWTRIQHHNMLMSIQDMGVDVLTTDDLDETVEVVRGLREWARKPEHLSLSRRPKVKGTWGKASNRDFARHLLQSFDGIGVKQADAIIDFFGGVPLIWLCTKEQLMKVPGIGKVRAERLASALGQEVER